MFLERRQLVPECILWCRNLEVPWERTVPFLEYFWKRVYCLPWTKDPAVASQRLLSARWRVFTLEEGSGSKQCWFQDFGF